MKEANDKILKNMGNIGNTNSDKIYKYILRCMRNHNKPDLHSFMINIENGVAYVECRSHEIYIESRLYGIDIDKIERWCGTAIAAANRLEMLKADYYTIDM